MHGETVKLKKKMFIFWKIQASSFKKHQVKIFDYWKAADNCIFSKPFFLNFCSVEVPLS